MNVRLQVSPHWGVDIRTYKVKGWRRLWRLKRLLECRRVR